MSASINKVILIGNLGDDVKIHYFDNGNCIGRFPLATSEYYTNKEGERVTQTEWHNIVVRNKRAESCEKFLSKGDKIYIEGRIKTRKWESDTGTRYSTEIHGDDIQFLVTKGIGESFSKQKSSQYSPEAQEQKNEDDEDLPF